LQHVAKISTNSKIVKSEPSSELVELTWSDPWMQ